MRKSSAVEVAANASTPASSAPSRLYTAGATQLARTLPWSADTPRILSARRQQQIGERRRHQLVAGGVGMDPVRPEQARVAGPGHRPGVQAERPPASGLLPDDVAGVPQPLTRQLHQLG